MLRAKSYCNRPMFHGAIEKIIVVSFYGQGALKVILFFNNSLASGKTKNI